MNQSELQWLVPELHHADPGSGNSTAQLFAGKKSIPLNIFVREDLQNRVDARVSGDASARVLIRRFEVPGTLIAKYFPKHFQEELKETETADLDQRKAKERRDKLDELFNRRTMPVLVIEDFGTTGLNGPVNSRMPVKVTGNPLYHATNALTCFLRCNGKSGKTGRSLGSAGMGRHVYYKASEISAKLVYTRPIDLYEERAHRLHPISPRPLFFGQSFQSERGRRDEDGTQRVYSAYHHLTSAKSNPDGFPMPFGLQDDEADLVESVRTDFRLERSANEVGCSIIIPFPKPNFTHEKLVPVIVREFALPILLGHLEVDIGDEKIRADNVSELSDDKSVNATNRFLYDAGRRIAKRVPVTVTESGIAVDNSLFEEEHLSQLTEIWKERGLVCVEFDVFYGLGPDQNGVARVAVQRCEPRLRGRGVVARGGLPLSHYSEGTSSWNGCTLLGPDSLGQLLRTCETPSHDRWIPGDLDVSDCSFPEQLVRFVSTAHASLATLLERLESEEDLSVFADVLAGRGGRGTVDPVPALPPPFRVTMLPDRQTISITPTGAYDAELGGAWTTTLVYDSILGAGRARKSFRRGEFDLTTVPCEVRGGTVRVLSECSLALAVDDPNLFEARIGPCGFADWADLRIHAVRRDME